MVIHENRVLVPYLRDVVDGLASSGYLAVAPDLASRAGRTAAAQPSVGTALGQARSSGQADADSLAVVEYLARQFDVTKISIVGFCYGGGMWNVATMSPELAAVVPFYGRYPSLDAVPNITAAVFAIIADMDSGRLAGV